jgi:hypothetical protein
VLSLLGLFFFTLYFNQLTVVDKWFGISAIIITLINCGAMLEQQKWVFQVEVVRLLLICTYASILEHSFGLFIVSVLTVLILSTFEFIENQYYKFVLRWRGSKPPQVVKTLNSARIRSVATTLNYIFTVQEPTPTCGYMFH